MGRQPRPAFVLLDLYDTLVTFDRRRVETGRAATAAGLGVTPEALARADHATMPGRMLGRHGCLHGELAELLRVAGSDACDAAVSAFVDAELRMWEDAAIVHDDVRPALARLRRHGVRLALVSNCCHLTPPLLDAWRLRDCFDAVALSCQVGCVKPAPELFRLTLAAIGGEPARALVVDDQQGYVDAALAAGLQGRRIDRGRAQGGPGVVSDLGQLADELVGP